MVWDHGLEAHATTLREVTDRATQTLEWAANAGIDLLSAALDHLTLGRAGLYGAILSPSEISNLKSEIQTHLTAAIDGLRESGSTHHVPRGLLTRAWYLAWRGDSAGAAADLDEAWEIAERGPMPLFQADILLTRARLFGRYKHAAQASESSRPDTPATHLLALRACMDYPWPESSPQADLAEARRLIEKHGYHRRDQELADTEAALQAQSETIE